MSLRYEVCDVFTDRPLTGNQVAVFADAGDVSSALMQPLAREINLSETVFVLPPAAGGDARLRIFTPAVELPFAGHPTLGTGWVLAHASGRDRLVLETGVGPVPLEFEREDGSRLSLGRMSQIVPSVEPYSHARELLEALGVTASLLPVEVYDNGPTHAFVCVDGSDAVARLRPDMRRLEALPGLVGANVFAFDGESVRTRMFGPWVGVPEDPATGSAAGPLAVHLVRHGRVAPGREIVISQGSEIGRPSTLLARVTGRASAIDEVHVGGCAVIVGSGEFVV